MKSNVLFRPSNWIELLKMKWHLLAPPHRLFICTLVFGIFFTTGVALCLQLDNTSEKPAESSPDMFALRAEQNLLAETSIELVFFSFHKKPESGLHTCDRPVNLAESNFLKGFKLIRPISKGTFLCWSHIAQEQFTSPHIRKGHRIMGFILSNPEIAPYITKGHFVDVILGGETLQSIPLEHLRILKLIPQKKQLTVLLELTKKQVVALEEQSGLYTTVQVLLKSQKEPENKKRRKTKRYQPKIHKG